jgi:hypothetical protein
MNDITPYQHEDGWAVKMGLMGLMQLSLTHIKQTHAPCQITC